MSKKIVIFIQSDPCKSHRPCEALRVALGLASCNHAVDLILSSHAPLLLTDRYEELVNGEESRDYLSRLQEWIPCFLIVCEGNETLPQSLHPSIAQSSYSTSFVSQNEIAEKVLGADGVMVF